MNYLIIGLSIIISFNVFGYTPNENALKVINYEKKEIKKPIIVATIDTGLNNNENIAKYINKNEVGIVDSPFCNGLSKPLLVKKCNKSTNKIDDDKNGYIDDVNGWDFVNNKSWLYDGHGHGTHVAGIIASKKYGVASGVEIMPLSYHLTDESPNLDALRKKYKAYDIGELALLMSIEGLNYAINNGAKIVNYSGGGMFPHDKELAILKKARDLGILIIVAAGNEGSNIDLKTNSYYPCSYKLDNIICVGNYDQNKNTIASSSNYGKSVDVFAPGYSIISDSYSNGSKILTGTSQATPYVTGLAALLMSENEKLNAQQIKKLILSNVEYKVNLNGYCKTSGIINFKKTLDLDSKLNRSIANN